MALAMCAGVLVSYGHHHSAFWGGFAGGLVGGLVRPAPVVVATPTVVTTPTVVASPTVVATPAPVVTTTTTIPSYSYGYYNNVYCPTYSGYYWYGNNWVWGGGYGHRPPVPMWRPHHHYRPAPPPIHHGGYRPGGFHGGGFHRGGFHGGGPHRR